MRKAEIFAAGLLLVLTLSAARGCNRAPVLVDVGAVTACEEADLSIQLVATDIDGDPLVYGGQNLPAGSFLDPTTGLFSWRPADVQAGTYLATFTVTDGRDSDATAATLFVGDAEYLAYAAGPGTLLAYNRCEDAWSALPAPPAGAVTSLQFVEPHRGFAAIDDVVWEFDDGAWSVFFDDLAARRPSFYTDARMVFPIYHGAAIVESGEICQAQFVAPYEVNFRDIYARADGAYSGYGMYTEGHWPAPIGGSCTVAGPGQCSCMHHFIDVPHSLFGASLGETTYDPEFGDAYTVSGLDGGPEGVFTSYLFGPWGSWDVGVVGEDFEDVALGGADVAYLLTEDDQAAIRDGSGYAWLDLPQVGGEAVAAYGPAEAWVVGTADDAGFAVRLRDGTAAEVPLPGAPGPWGLSQVDVVRLAE